MINRALYREIDTSEQEEPMRPLYGRDEEAAEIPFFRAK